MNKYQQKHRVKLSRKEKDQLEDITKKGKHNARVIKRAHILIQSAQNMKDKDIATVVGVSARTVENIRKRFVEGGMKSALYDAPRPGAPRKLDDKVDAYLVATACSSPPDGITHWTLELLQKKLIKDKKIKSISTVALWHHLNERGIKPWREKNVVHTKN